MESSELNLSDYSSNDSLGGLVVLFFARMEQGIKLVRSSLQEGN